MINEANTLDLDDLDDIQDLEIDQQEPQDQEPQEPQESQEPNDEFDLTRELLTRQGISDINKIKFIFVSGDGASGIKDYKYVFPNAIYVFDADVAQRVSVGNNITIAASKTWWVLEKEQSSAEKFGYKGCCQLENATLVSNDEKENDFNQKQ